MPDRLENALDHHPTPLELISAQLDEALSKFDCSDVVPNRSASPHRIRAVMTTTTASPSTRKPVESAPVQAAAYDSKVRFNRVLERLREESRIEPSKRRA